MDFGPNIFNDNYFITQVHPTRKYVCDSSDERPIFVAGEQFNRPLRLVWPVLAILEKVLEALLESSWGPEFFVSI